MKRQISFGVRMNSGNRPDLNRLAGVVAPEILVALQAASAALDRAGVRHALVGALAVGAYGYPRASKDVDFLVGDEAFDVHEGGVVTVRPGVPIRVRGIDVDLLLAMPGEQHLEAAVQEPLMDQGIPIVSPEVLVYLKLKSPRRKDAADVVELLIRGLGPEPIRTYLERHAPDLLGKFEELAQEAEE